MYGLLDLHFSCCFSLWAFIYGLFC